jgi:hypothetical protein
LIIAFCLALSFAGHVSGTTGPLSPRLIVEFENSQLGSYHLAAPDEANWMDQGGAGPGWVRTGESFWEESALANLVGAPCRFYGSVSPGPNSHFFTLNAAECAWLTSLAAKLPPDVPKWNYEGFAFNVVPLVDGQCPITERSTATAPVYRLYDRAVQHRYTTSRQIVDQMKGRGWVEEGIAWCVRPNGPWT